LIAKAIIEDSTTS